MSTAARSSMAVSITKNKSLLAVMIARLISVAGNGFGRIALAFGVLKLAGPNAGILSIVLFCQAFPQLIFILVGGLIGDRCPRRLAMISADLISASAWCGLSVIFAIGHSPIWLVASFGAVAGLGSALFIPPSEGIIADLAESGQRHAANSFVRQGSSMGMLLGLVIAGPCVALVGASAAAGIDAASFGVSAALMMAVSIPHKRSARRQGPIAELRAGWREFIAHQWLWVVTIQFSVLIAVLNAFLGFLGPLMAVRFFGGAVAWSAMAAAQAAGMLAGSFAVLRIRPRHPIRVAVLLTLGFALPMLLTATHLGVPAIVCGMLVAGMSQTSFGVLWSTTVQHEVPQDALARVSSWDVLGSLALAPIALLVVGPIALKIGLIPTLYICVGLVLVAFAGAMLSPQVRRLGAASLLPENAEQCNRSPRVPLEDEFASRVSEAH